MKLAWLIVVAGLAVLPPERTGIPVSPETVRNSPLEYSQSPIQPSEPDIRIPVLPAEAPLDLPIPGQQDPMVALRVPGLPVIPSEASAVSEALPASGTAAAEDTAVPQGTAVPEPSTPAAGQAPAPAITPAARPNPLAAADPVRPRAFLESAEPVRSAPTLVVRSAEPASTGVQRDSGAGVQVRAIDAPDGGSDGVVNSRLEIQLEGEGWVFLPAGSGLDLVNTTRTESRSRFVFLAREAGDYVLNFSSTNPESGAQQRTSVPVAIATGSAATESRASGEDNQGTERTEPTPDGEEAPTPAQSPESDEIDAAAEVAGPPNAEQWDPGDSAALLALARSLEHRVPDGPERARSLYEQILRDDPLSLEADTARERLRYLDRFFFRVR